MLPSGSRSQTTPIESELLPRPWSELSELDRLATLWRRLPGYVAACARREGVSPQRVLELLGALLPDDETWYANLAAFDADVRAAEPSPPTRLLRELET